MKGTSRFAGGTLVASGRLPAASLFAWRFHGKEMIKKKELITCKAAVINKGSKVNFQRRASQAMSNPSSIYFMDCPLHM